MISREDIDRAIADGTAAYKLSEEGIEHWQELRDEEALNYALSTLPILIRTAQSKNEQHVYIYIHPSAAWKFMDALEALGVDYMDHPVSSLERESKYVVEVKWF